MSDVLMVGCDLHDRTMMLKSCIGKDGAVRTRTVPNDRGSRRILIELLKSEATAARTERIVFAYEASGQGFGLYDQLRAAGIECHVLAPTKIVKTPGERKRKTDDRDAQKILDLVRAHVLAGASLPTVWVPGLQTRDDREVVRQRVTVADKRCKVKTQVQSLLKRCDLRKPAEMKPWTKAFESWLQQLAEGRMADGSPSPLGWGARHALRSLLRELKFWDEELSLLDEPVRELAQSERYESAVREQTQEDGVGMLTSLVFLSELGDVTRFDNRRQVGAYLGLAPSCFESGDSDDRKGHITRQGPGRVRKLLCQACWVAVRVNPKERTRYQTLKARNPNKPKIAIVAAMRRLAIRLWHKAKPPSPERSLKENPVKQKPGSSSRKPNGKKECVFLRHGRANE
jgi:transposase